MTDSAELVARRALAIVAHPDDLEFPAGGTVAGWVAQGWQVTLCVVTDGQRGTEGPAELDRPTEQEAAARTLGIDSVIFMRRADTEIEPSLELRMTFANLIRQVRPHRVLTHSPRFAWGLPLASHPDHRAVGQAAIDAVYPEARARVSSAGASQPSWAVHEVWLFGDPEANHIEDVTDQLSVKVSALRCHRSQVSGAPDWQNALVDRMAQTARTAGLKSGRLAERFQVLGYR